ncbi:MAG: HPr family phosphocarrier protein [Kiritimatiellia bacterium]|nr:HPr family phosphocarrier protein [Lentisphaerota bacterium]
MTTSKGSLRGVAAYMEREIEVTNQYGMHARPAAMLVKTASRFQADITICKGDVKVSGKSIMGLMTLEAGFGSRVKLTAEGVDAGPALDAIQELFERKFYEE